MKKANSEHQLWVNFSCLEKEKTLFALLPEIMEKFDTCVEEPFDLILPSDDDWQTKIYYKLVERQRIVDAYGTCQLFVKISNSMEDYLQDVEPSPKLHDWLIFPKEKHRIQCERVKSVEKIPKTGPIPITWTVSDIAKAGCILTRPPLETNFEDEQEMRRVYTLIYDVFRHKNILAQALNDINFFLEFPQHETNISHILLLFYDLYHRAFKKRETAVVHIVKRLFEGVGLMKAEEALWEFRTRLAAAVARLRIQNNALSLSDLLPSHLRNDKVQGSRSKQPVTCWINLKKVKNISELKTQIQSEFGLKPILETEALDPKTYKWDKHCPYILTFHSSLRPILAKSSLIKTNKLIVQDRSFCLGPATFSQHVSDLQLTGSVIQTHINSPRTTAYLAIILSQNEKIKKLLAFSAGALKNEYESYFQALGINVSIFSERLIDVSPDSGYMEEVVAVFATPPNSYSAVSDPIDLVCSRGGDLSMLEILTEAEESEKGKERVLEILEEQRKTLRFAMSRPQIQFVLYETHSGIGAENEGMIDKTVKDVNKNVKLHHATGKLPTNQEEINNNENFDKILVPDTDVFDVPELPQLCPGETSCINYTKEGCYLALVQRKQVIRLDNKYMIQMAENRGLFGRASTSSTKSKSSKLRKKNKPLTPPPKTKKRIKEAEVARIAAPTQTFLRHVRSPCEIPTCDRCKSDEKKVPIYRQWWYEATRHILALRSNLIKHKIVPNQIDEIVAKSRTSIPIFPKLKLTRENRSEKVQLHLPVTVVQFV